MGLAYRVSEVCTWIALCPCGPSWAKGNIVVVKGNGELQQTETPHLLHVHGREIVYVCDSQYVRHYGKTLMEGERGGERRGVVSDG